ncbi:MAG: hypothetical protein LBN34_04815, partial [Clostridiales Family XIII bacterium]|nr:hypothetical protein [Clostridiales Family XIII bacterium]
MNNFKDGKREVKWGAKRKHLGRKAMTGFVAMLLFVMTLLPTSVMADSGNGGGDLGNASAAADVIPASEPETTNGDKNWIHCDSPDGSSQHRSGQARNDSDSNKDWIAGQARNDSNDSNDGNDGNDSEIDFQSLDISDGSIFSALALLADEGLGALSGEDLVIGALAAPADVTLNSVTATNVAGASGDVYTYNTWTTSPATGDFRLNVNFQFANGIATLGDVKLKVKLTSAQAAFATSNAYVVTSSPANAYIDETNLAIDGDGNLSLNFKQGTSGSAGSVIIAFPFNHTLDGWLSGYTTTGETFANFEVFTESGGATGTATSVTVGSSATIRGSGVDLYSRTPAEHVLVGSDMTLQPRFFDRYTDEWRHEPNSIVTFTMDYPNGATVLDAVGGTVNTGNHTITWSYTADSVTGIIPHSASGWSSSPMAYVFMPTVRINFPASAFATVNDEDDVVLKLKSESYFVGKTEQYVITSDDYEFKVFNTDSVLAGIRMKNAAFQYSGGPHIIKNISTVSSGASALGNLGNGNMGLWNVGLKPIPNTCVIWRNNSDATKKINVFSVQARNGGTTPPSRIEFYVCNSDGSHAESKWPTSINLAFYSAYNISDLNLSNGQYIEMIKSYPQYNPDTGNIDALPVGASAGLVVNFTGFSDGKYPDGTLIGNGDELSWSLEGVWEGETKVEDFAGLAEYSYEPSTKISSMKYEGKDEQKIFYCAPVPSPTAQMHITSSTTVAPRDLMNVNLRFYNSTAGNPMGPRTVWENPTFVILPPDGLSFDPADNTNLVAYKPNDDVWSNDVEVSETTRNGRTVYIVTVKGELAALDSWSYIKDLKFTVKDDAPIGANTIASYRDEPTFNTERNGFVFATSETPNNLVPDNVIPFAGTVYRGFVSDTSLQSGGWDANVNTNFIGRPPSNGGTISFNVSPLPSVDVRAEMYDTEVTGDADPWKNVSSNVEVPTVLGDSAQMRLVIENAGNTFLGNLRLLDILPKIGDKLVLAPGTEKGSTWDAFMGAIDIQVENIKTEEIISGAALATAYPGFAVQYCKNNNPSINNGVVRTGTGGNFANDAAGDPTEAGSFFFTMGANKLPPGYRIILNFEITAPTSAALDDISAKAFNSFAYLYTNYNDASGNGADAK